MAHVSALSRNMGSTNILKINLHDLGIQDFEIDDIPGSKLTHECS